MTRTRAASFAALLSAATICGSLPLGRADAQSMDEYKVKALFIYNFAKFVDWPARTFSGPKEPIRVCVLGSDPFGSSLEEAIAERSVGEHPLVVHRLSDVRRAGACRILFVSSSERKRQASILEAVKASGVLTVGETDDFAAAGGAVQFVLEGGRIRFEINQHAATDQKLRISPHVLNLAKVVKK